MFLVFFCSDAVVDFECAPSPIQASINTSRMICTEWNLKNKASGRVNWARPGQILLPYTAIFHGIFWIIPKSMKLLLSQNIKFSTARAWKTKPTTARLKPPALIIDLVISMSEDMAMRTNVCPIVSSMSTTCLHRYTPALLSSCYVSHADM